MPQFQVRLPAGENEVFAKDAFDSQIGKMVRNNIFGEVKFVAAEVVSNGKAALLTFESEDSIFPKGRHIYHVV